MPNPTYLTLGQAAKQVGKSKATLSTALKKGKLSYVEKTGAGYKIDPAELLRVYPNSLSNSKTEQLRTPSSNPINAPEIITLKAKLDAAEDRIANDRETIEDLRRRLDEESSERRKLTAMLTDQREQPKGFFRKLFG